MLLEIEAAAAKVLLKAADPRQVMFASLHGLRAGLWHKCPLPPSARLLGAFLPVRTCHDLPREV